MLIRLDLNESQGAVRCRLVCTCIHRRPGQPERRLLLVRIERNAYRIQRGLSNNVTRRRLSDGVGGKQQESREGEAEGFGGALFQLRPSPGPGFAKLPEGIFGFARPLVIRAEGRGIDLDRLDQERLGTFGVADRHSKITQAT